MDSQRRGARTILHQSEAAARHEPGRVRRPGAGTFDASEWWIAAHSRLARKSLSAALITCVRSLLLCHRQRREPVRYGRR